MDNMPTNGTREKENPISGSDSISAMKTVALRRSLLIKSTNLIILDTIGQGCKHNCYIIFYECHNVFQLIR